MKTLKSINAQIRVGFLSTQKYEEILDRAEAIERAITQAQEGDTILIAGKGHETVQIIGEQRIAIFRFRMCE